jgi:hypothetical protein
VPAAADEEREVKAGVGGERVRVGRFFMHLGINLKRLIAYELLG